MIVLESPSSTYALVVDNLDNRGKLAAVGVLVGEQDDAANLDRRPLGTLNVELGHRDLVLCERVYVRSWVCVPLVFAMLRVGVGGVGKSQEDGSICEQ